MSTTKPKVPSCLCYIGPPGAGKGTVADYISRSFNMIHISAGDLLRNEVKNGTPLGKEVIGPILERGEIVPNEITVKLLIDTVVKASTERPTAQAVILDGFPRTVVQSDMFEQQLAPYRAVVYFDCNMATMEKRLLGRGRADDKPEIIIKRFEQNLEKCVPVMEKFAAEGQDRLKKVDTNATVDKVCKAAFELHVSLGFKPVDLTEPLPQVPSVGGADQ